jgi:acetyl-CoA carboxylase carboxyl transferase subunit beta
MTADTAEGPTTGDARGSDGGGLADDAPVEYVELWDRDEQSNDPLGFPGYVPPAPDDESVRTGLAVLGGVAAAVVECRFPHHGGTMGAVAGDRIVRAFRRATARGLPVVAFIASGGARLQEGMVSLVQMARTSSAVLAHQRAGLLFVAVLRPHSTGGVYASWASLSDLRAATPGATVGFGGPRVVEQVTGELPPKTSHTAESAYRNGVVDALVAEPDQIRWLGDVLSGRAPGLVVPDGRPAHVDRTPLPTDPWDLLQRTRSPQRPSGVEWAAWLTDSWVELRGPDPTIRAGLATIGGRRLVVVANDRHADAPGADRHAIGDAGARPGPQAYKLARRAMHLADRLRLPVLTVVDMPGAEPGPVAEAQGIAGEIARTHLTMAGLTVPTVALCVGEGGSGGAMALSHGDRFLMLDGAVFSVIGPEAGAVILYRDAARAPQLTRDLRMTGPELVALGVVDELVPESAPDPVAAARAAVVDGLETASVGNRVARPDTVTNRALGR